MTDEMQPMDLFPKEKSGMTVGDLMTGNRKLMTRYQHQFQQTFGISLYRFMNPIFGFDVISFDENFLRTPDGISSADFITQKYGAEASKLIFKLIGNEEDANGNEKTGNGDQKPSGDDEKS